MIFRFQFTREKFHINSWQEIIDRLNIFLNVPPSRLIAENIIFLNVEFRKDKREKPTDDVRDALHWKKLL